MPISYTVVKTTGFHEIHIHALRRRRYNPDIPLLVPPLRGCIVALFRDLYCLCHPFGVQIQL